MSQSVTPTLPTTGRAWYLTSRPQGWPTPADFALRSDAIPALNPGQVLVENLYLSVDPYMRGRMDDAESYIPPFELNQPMDGGAIGVVLASKADGIAVGDHVQHLLGWREFAVLDAEAATVVDAQVAPLTTYFSVLGITGLTAYAGLLRVAELKKGETVFVSGAAGAVGSQAGQLARLMGAARVIGSAGSDEKVKLLVEEYGFDAAFNYKRGPVADQLKLAAPDGIDVYFDNVGGEHLEAAIGALNLHGRVVLCGMIAQYNAVEPPSGPRNLWLAVANRLHLHGMIILDHLDLNEEFIEKTIGWMRDNRIRYQETVVEGFENTLEAFFGVLRGENTGKMIVKLRS
jgi:NADPH-dependent curcumin reductase CurA